MDVLTAIVVVVPTAQVYVVSPSLPTEVPTPAVQPSLQLHARVCA